MPYHTNLAAILRGAGLRVVEVPGWQSRGHGPMGPARAIMWHHDATPAGAHIGRLNTVIRDGHSSLRGPLSAFYLNRDGTWYVVAAGVSWHAGNGYWPGLGTNTGNSNALGIEAGNNGVGEPWPAVQIDSYRRGTAALCRAFGLGSDRVVGHKEYARPRGRKIDPGGLDMNAERRHVQNYINGAPAPGNQEEDLIVMSLASKFKDWAGNTQTGHSWANNVDKRLYEIHNALLGLQESRIPGDKNKTNVVNAVMDSTSWSNQTLGHAAAARDELGRKRASLVDSSKSYSQGEYAVFSDKNDYDNAKRLDRLEDKLDRLVEAFEVHAKVYTEDKE